jgi:hypothetical protein
MFFKAGDELSAYLLGCFGGIGPILSGILAKNWWEISFDIRYLYAFICLIDLPNIRAKI